MWNIIGKTEKQSNWGNRDGKRAKFHRPVFEGVLNIDGFYKDSVRVSSPSGTRYYIKDCFFRNLLQNTKCVIDHGKMTPYRYILDSKYGSNRWAKYYLMPLVDGNREEDWNGFKSEEEVEDYRQGIIESIPAIL